jgi:DNA-binding transcriptional MerR regulator
VDYRIEELAEAAAVPIDTIRYYQAQGLLERPRRAGRHVLYSQRHLARLRRIRALQADGLSLQVIRRLVQGRGGKTEAALIRALSKEQGARQLDRKALAAESGVPEALLKAVEEAGLVEPMRVGSKARYGDVDVQIARLALSLLREGFPLTDLLALGISHADHVREITDRAGELFDRWVRRDRSGDERPAKEVVAAFQRLLPAVTALVAHHFQRTLVARALDRLARAGDEVGLKHALAAANSGRLEIAWR